MMQRANAAAQLPQQQRIVQFEAEYRLPPLSDPKHPQARTWRYRILSGALANLMDFAASLPRERQIALFTAIQEVRVDRNGARWDLASARFVRRPEDFLESLLAASKPNPLPTLAVKAARKTV